MGVVSTDELHHEDWKFSRGGFDVARRRRRHRDLERMAHFYSRMIDSLKMAD